MYLLLLFCGALAGVTTVLFGFGGGFVVVPLLYAVLTLSHGADSAIGAVAMQVAVATSTAVMVFGAGMASWRHHRAGTVDWGRVRAFAGYIALGAIGGAWMATALRGDWVRWAFVAYLGVTILDCLVRPGFMAPAATSMRTMSRRATALAGLVIGAIAAFLGVGGSVMTVPLMRRQGASMTQATAMANPLSLPMAVAGSLAYVAFAWRQGAMLGAGYAGYVDLRAFLVLAAGSWIGIRATSPFIGRIPDSVHARVYLFLLVLVLVMMAVV
ncbi:MAG: hypothetical protein GAK28_01076 [Luteibacter sp.]|uniref:sulfite exporter TauE/SafE family protein n=1 Tax=Luteibacter sp. TaxID=1886636 RepID=UPI0013833B98|nr:sulfite exporter TauE/SafE family protein [Luteibacter sp.]KAF1008652.1 MAG: hypothetical protein GAK28_01076 [Luteibacter sp.]